MHLTDADKQGIAEAAKVMADAGRVDMAGVQHAARVINEATPTAAQAGRALIDSHKTMKSR